MVELYLMQIIDRSFGFDSAVEEAERAITAAHVEATSHENGIGLVKLMGRYSGMLSENFCWFIRWMYALFNRVSKSILVCSRVSETCDDCRIYCYVRNPC